MLRAAALGAFTAAAFAVVAAAVLAVPGTGSRAAAAAARPHAAVTAAAPRHAVARVAARVHRPKSTPHAKTLAYSYSMPVAAPASAPAPAPAAPATPERDEHQVARIIATVAQRAVPRTADPAPSRGTQARRIPSIRPELGPTETLAFVAPHRKCRTCFGPLRSPDDAADQPATAGKPVPAAGAGAAAIVADDPTSGPVDLGSGLIWYRLPARVQGP